MHEISFGELTSDPAQHLSKIKRAPDMKYSLCSLADNFDKANKDIKLNLD